MSDKLEKLPYPPIVEAVVDIHCDVPSPPDGEATKRAFTDHYPVVQTRAVNVAEFSWNPEGPVASQPKHGVAALQFLHADLKQIVQVRPLGYSFNRLAPYTGFDDYLPEIERTWRIFAGLTKPKLVRGIGLRYINRIMLPIKDGVVNFGEYLTISPRLPEGSGLSIAGFLHQYSAMEPATNNIANIVFTIAPDERIPSELPLILDISVEHVATYESDDWDAISARISSLRDLKNRIFGNTLTAVCLNLFQQPWVQP